MRDRPTGIGRVFQSTFPRGERLLMHKRGIYFDNFNPRSRVGNDKRYQEFALRYLDFNPRSRVGNDCCIKKIEYGGYNFNPRSRVGNDIVFRSEPDEHSDFNPRSRVGNDKVEIRGWARDYISIHVPAWGTTCGLS